MQALTERQTQILEAINTSASNHIDGAVINAPDEYMAQTYTLLDDKFLAALRAALKPFGTFALTLYQGDNCCTECQIVGTQK